MRDSERALARALCDSSSHANLLPHEEQRPCDYHVERAKATLAMLEQRGYGLGVMIEPPPSKPHRDVDAGAERSRLNAENLRRRIPPVGGVA